MLKKVIFIQLIMLACNDMGFNLNINVKEIDRVRIVRNEDGREIIIKEKKLIEDLYYYFYGGKTELVKFYPNYRLYFSYKRNELLILASKKNFKYNGGSYKLKKELGDFMTQLFQK